MKTITQKSQENGINQAVNILIHDFCCNYPPFCSDTYRDITAFFLSSDNILVIQSVAYLNALYKAYYVQLITILSKNYILNGYRLQGNNKETAYNGFLTCFPKHNSKAFMDCFNAVMCYHYGE